MNEGRYVLTSPLEHINL